MKRIMFLLAFVSIGIFANASNGKVKKIKFLSEVKMSIKKRPVYTVWVDCGPGVFWAGCCWNMAAEAYQAGANWAAANCL